MDTKIFEIVENKNGDKVITNFLDKSNTGKVIIPEGITKIHNHAFKFSKAKSFIFPSTLRIIGKSAFMECKNLEHIVLPDNIESIDSNTFNNCSNLKSIKFPKNLSYIPEFCCYLCTSLEKIILPENLSTIGKSAFENTAIKNITLPEEMTEIGRNAFAGCYDLENITLPIKITTFNDYVFSSKMTKLKDIVMPRLIINHYKAIAITDDFAHMPFHVYMKQEYIDEYKIYKMWYNDKISDITLDKMIENGLSLSQANTILKFEEKENDDR